MMSRGSQGYIEIKQASYAIVHGTMVAIDPSIGSLSSMPGWAVYKKGELNDSGTLQIRPEGSIPERLRELAYLLRKLYRKVDPDVLVYEQIPVTAHGNRSQVGHASLLKALGAILSVAGPDQYVGISPISWKKLVRESYRKGDETDAIEMGWIAVEQARVVLEKDNPKHRFGKKRKSHVRSE